MGRERDRGGGRGGEGERGREGERERKGGREGYSSSVEGWCSPCLRGWRWGEKETEGGGERGRGGEGERGREGPP